MTEIDRKTSSARVPRKAPFGPHLWRSPNTRWAGPGPRLGRARQGRAAAIRLYHACKWVPSALLDAVPGAPAGPCQPARPGRPDVVKMEGKGTCNTPQCSAIVFHGPLLASTDSSQGARTAAPYLPRADRRDTRFVPVTSIWFACASRRHRMGAMSPCAFRLALDTGTGQFVLGARAIGAAAQCCLGSLPRLGRFEVTHQVACTRWRLRARPALHRGCNTPIATLSKSLA